MEDTLVLETSAFGRGGSSPSRGTKFFETTIFDMQRVRVEGPPPVPKTGAPQGWLFDSATLCQIYARVLLGEQLDSKPNARRSNRRPSATEEEADGKPAHC